MNRAATVSIRTRSTPQMSIRSRLDSWIADRAGSLRGLPRFIRESWATLRTDLGHRSGHPSYIDAGILVAIIQNRSGSIVRAHDGVEPLIITSTCTPIVAIPSSKRLFRSSPRSTTKQRNSPRAHSPFASRAWPRDRFPALQVPTEPRMTFSSRSAPWCLVLVKRTSEEPPVRLCRSTDRE
jgi:hypothetical protein